MLVIRKQDLDMMVCHALDGYPLEVCGLLVGAEVAGAGTRRGVWLEAGVAPSAGVSVESSASAGIGEMGPSPEREVQEANAEVAWVSPTQNVAASSKVYEIAPKALLEVDRNAEESGMQIVGVYHSHTHTDAKPSPTDIERAPDPSWHYVLVSLRDDHPSVRSWKIDDGKIEEEKVVVEW